MTDQITISIYEKRPPEGSSFRSLVVSVATIDKSSVSFIRLVTARVVANAAIGNATVVGFNFLLMLEGLLNECEGVHGVFSRMGGLIPVPSSTFAS
jgi:hypothetical protein